MGIVLSLLTLLIAPLLFWMHVANDAYDRQDTYNKVCITSAGDNMDALDSCWEQRREWSSPALWDVWSDAAPALAMVIIVLWILAYVTTYTIRWIMAGRKNNV